MGKYDQCRHGEPEGHYAACAACVACNGECGTCPYAPMTPAVPDPTVEALSEAEVTLTVAGDVLPDGRVDHRGHLRDEMVGDGTSTCLDCTSDDGDDPWVDVVGDRPRHGKPMPKDWRTMRYADVLALCGVSARAAAPDALALADKWEAWAEDAETKGRATALRECALDLRMHFADPWGGGR